MQNTEKFSALFPFPPEGPNTLPASPRVYNKNKMPANAKNRTKYRAACRRPRRS